MVCQQSLCCDFIFAMLFYVPMDIPVYAVIMAGGSGVRFWPKSRKKQPKPFLNFISDKTMIQSTVQRIESLVPLQNILVSMNADHEKIVLEQLPAIPGENIILEPAVKNTAPCIGLMALIVQHREPDAVMLVLPSDHWINDDKQFCEELKIAAERAAMEETLITFGNKPTYPETGYGYVQCGTKINMESYPGCEFYKVEKFEEKPGLEQAKKFIKDGNYYWNGGTFVWKASVILSEIEKYLPELYNGLMKIKECLGKDNEKDEIKKIFETFTSESIDYGVMEKTDRAEMIITKAGWGDVGSWKSLENYLEKDDSGNITSKKHILIDTDNSIIEGDKRLIAAIGLKDMVIVDTEDILLICPKDRSQEVKKLVERLKEEGREEYL